MNGLRNWIRVGQGGAETGGLTASVGRPAASGRSGRTRSRAALTTSSREFCKVPCAQSRSRPSPFLHSVRRGCEKEYIIQHFMWPVVGWAKCHFRNEAQARVSTSSMMLRSVDACEASLGTSRASGATRRARVFVGARRRVFAEAASDTSAHVRAVYRARRRAQGALLDGGQSPARRDRHEGKEGAMKWFRSQFQDG